MAASSKQNTPAPAPKAAPKGAPAPAPGGANEAKGMGYAAAAAHVAPGGGKESHLSPHQVSSAIKFNDARHFTGARWRAIQKTTGAKVDGDVGPDTVQHVAKWQGGHSLDADGKVGSKTWAALSAAGAGDHQDKGDDKDKAEKPKGGGAGGGGKDDKAELSDKELASAVKYNVESGFTYDQIVKIQGQVGAKVDGGMGPDTTRHVARWQAKHGLEPDGKIGAHTANKLGIQRGAGGGAKGPGASKLAAAMDRAKEMGLVITSTTGGKHTKGSYHYRGRAFDCAGSAKKMNAFFWEMVKTAPTELFYDPAGMVKYGHYQKRAIGGHSDHVHVAY